MAAIWISRRANHIPYAWTDADTGLTGNNPRIYVERNANQNRRLHLLYDDGTTSYSRYSDDNGYTFSSATSIGTGTNPCGVFLPNGSQCLYRLDGTTIKGIVRDKTLTVYESSFTATTTVDATTRFSVDWCPVVGGSQVILLLYVDGGNVKYKTATTGVNFGSATTIEAGGYPEVVCGPDNAFHLYWLTGTNARGMTLTPNLATVHAAATVLASVDTGTPLACSWTAEQGGTGKVCMIAFQSGQMAEYSSTSGMSFV